METAPPLKGYVRFIARPAADTILAVDQKDPLLVRWQYGLGRAAVFTSDAKSRWAEGWVNWGGYDNPKVNEAIDKIGATFDTKEQDKLLTFVHEQMVNDALMLWVVHDTNPHAMSPKVKQFVQAQHWFQDLTTIGM